MPKEEKINIDDAPPVDEDAVDDNQDDDVTDDDTDDDVTTDDDAESSKTTEDEGTDDEADDEFVEDEKEWLAQFEGMPDGIDSVEQLAESYTASLKEMNNKQQLAAKYAKLEETARLKGFDNVDAFLAGNVTTQPAPVQRTQQFAAPEGETYFTPNPVRTVIDNMLKEGTIPQESVSSYNAVAKVVDNAITPQFQRAEQVMTLAMQQVLAMRETVKKLEWNAVPTSVRGSVSRQEVDKLLDSGAVSSIEEAIQFLHFKNPDLLKDIARKAEEKGVERGRKKLKRSGSIKRGKEHKAPRSWDYDKYKDYDGNWDTKKLGSMPVDDSIKMLEDYEKENFPK